MGIPASGKSIDIQAIDILRFGADGLAHEHWGVMDIMSMMQQIGAVPQGPPAQRRKDPRRSLTGIFAEGVPSGSFRSPQIGAPKKKCRSGARKGLLIRLVLRPVKKQLSRRCARLSVPR